MWLPSPQQRGPRPQHNESSPHPTCTPLPQASRRVMRRLRAHDQAKRETAKARNDMEAYIIATRDLVRGHAHSCPACRCSCRCYAPAPAGCAAGSMHPAKHCPAVSYPCAWLPTPPHPTRLPSCSWTAPRSGGRPPPRSSAKPSPPSSPTPRTGSMAMARPWMWRSTGGRGGLGAVVSKQGSLGAVASK